VPLLTDTALLIILFFRFARSEHSVDSTIVIIADEIWSQLVAASLVENTTSISSYYNNMLKNEDKSDFKLPYELTVDEFHNIPPKLTWILNYKYSKFSINMLSSEAHIHLGHLLIFTAYNLKVFGEMHLENK
jgi:hypothetical protein